MKPSKRPRPSIRKNPYFRKFSYPTQVVLLAEEDLGVGSDSPDWRPYNLPKPMLAVWAVTQAQGTIMNGSLAYFFENDWPEQPPYSLFVEAYRQVGSTEAADCLADAVEALRLPNAHLDYKARRAVIYSEEGRENHISEVVNSLGCRMIDLEETTNAALAEFISLNRIHFPNASEHIKAHELQLHQRKRKA